MTSELLPFQSADSPIRYRPYQLEALKAIADARRAGTRRQAVVLPTGAGKTILFAARALMHQKRGSRALILAHRDELIQQPLEKLRRVNSTVAPGVVKAKQNEHAAKIVIASVQTLAVAKRLAQLAPMGPEDVVIIDEAHHAAARTYVQIMEHLGVFRDDGPLLIGVTATLEREDKKKLGDVFQSVVFEKNILEMIRAGFLCDIRALQIKLAVDFNDLRTRAGDFIESEVDELLDAADAPTHAANAYLAHAKGRKAILFASSVRQAYRMADALRKAGVRAEAIDGTTGDDERKAALARLASGETTVLCNCSLLTEGFDEPSISCVMVCRPTKSRGLYVQMVGRGLRPHPGKPDCLLLDLVGIADRHDLVTAAKLFETTPEALATATVGEIDAEKREQASHGLREDVADEREGRLVAKALDLFRKTKVHWAQANALTYTASMGAAGRCFLTSDGRDGWTATLSLPFGREVLASDVPLDLAQSIAEDRIRAAGKNPLADKDARWRKREASAKQVDLLKKLKLLPAPNGHPLTAGEAADLIDAYHAARDLEPPSMRQLGFLQKAGYDGPHPQSKREAGQLITLIKTPAEEVVTI